jgi:pyruvate/2-oxoglutarate dehydrogenase complex dihydrolipoamide acyltransferase (E2) component
MRRNWAKRVKDYTGMMQLSCDIKPNRSVRDVFINQKMDVTELMKYLDKKKKKGEKITFFHAIVTGVGKVYHNRPLLNRFVQDRHIFEHKYVDIAFVAKVAFEDKAEELMLVVRVDKKDNLASISKKLTEKIDGIRKNKNVVKKGGNKVIDVLGHQPNIIRVPVVGLLKWMDKKGILPDSIAQDNIYYSSIILSNLGAIHCGAIFHNITDFGNSSALATMGEIKDEEIIINGKKEVRKLCEFGINLDERIADGYYFAKSVQLLQYIFDNPELLEGNADEDIKIKD